MNDHARIQAAVSEAIKRVLRSTTFLRLANEELGGQLDTVGMSHLNEDKDLLTITEIKVLEGKLDCLAAMTLRHGGTPTLVNIE